MEKRQKIFVLTMALCLTLFTLVLLILNIARQQAAPAPFTPAAPAGSPTSPTGTAEEPGQIPYTSGKATPVPTIPGAPIPSLAPPTPTTETEVEAESPSPEESQVFYVASDGSEDNDGGRENPLELQYVLDHPDRIKPGATIWLLGGKYRGPFTSRLKGEENAPITVRAVPGERAILESDELVLDISTSKYVNFWGLEISATENARDPENRERGDYGVRINQGKSSHHIKFINMIIHDMPAQGFGWWQANEDSEIYGSLIFFNGITQFEHGIYLHNTDGEKRIVDNIIFDNASHGIHAYGEEDHQELNNIHIEGNTIFNNGSIGYITTQGSYGIYKRNILVGGSLHVANHPVIIDNYTYYPGTTGEALNLGYKAGSSEAVVENNYFAGGEVKLGGDNQDITMLANTIMDAGVSDLIGFATTGNTVMLFKPVETRFFVRPNQYEPGRANVTVYNWSLQQQVTLTAKDLAGVQIKKGDQYELRNVQDYFADVVTGTYDGEKITIPMTGHSVAQPLGLSFKPDSTFPEFGAFVLFVHPAD